MDCVAKLLPGRFFSVSTFTSSVGKGRMWYGYISILGIAVCFGVSFFFSFLKWKHACSLDVSSWTAANYLMSVRVFLVIGTHDLPSSCLVRSRRTRGRPWKFTRAVPWEMVWSKPRETVIDLGFSWVTHESHLPWLDLTSHEPKVLAEIPIQDGETDPLSLLQVQVTLGFNPHFRAYTISHYSLTKLLNSPSQRDWLNISCYCR